MKWVIERTAENAAELNEYLNNLIGSEEYFENDGWVYSERCGKDSDFVQYRLLEGFERIDIETFRTLSGNKVIEFEKVEDEPEPFPEFWAIVRTIQNHDKVNAYLNHITVGKGFRGFQFFVHSHTCGGENSHIHGTLQPGFTLITDEQFDRYVYSPTFTKTAIVGDGSPVVLHSPVMVNSPAIPNFPILPLGAQLNEAEAINYLKLLGYKIYKEF